MWQCAMQACHRKDGWVKTVPARPILDMMKNNSLAHPARWIGARAQGTLINGLVCLALCTRVNNYGYDVTYKYCIP